MEGQQGGVNFEGKGYPKSIFYELFDPQTIHRYTPREVLRLSVEHGHSGPWHHDFDEVCTEQMARGMTL
jgi:hypothetical protein